MEKLIELLNEYQKWKEKSEGTDDNFKWEKNYKGSISRYDEDDIREGENLYNDTAIAYLISKSFGFIKWLVENDKTEYRKIIEKEIEVGFKLVRIKDYPNKIMEEDVEALLMLLAIQDEPIRFLCEIIK